MPKPKREAADPDYVYPCPQCQPEQATDGRVLVEHWQGREGRPNVLIGYHVPDLRRPGEGRP